MNAKRITTIFLSIVLVGGAFTVAMALPDDYIVTYDIYDDPSDPNRQVVFSIELSLTAVSGNSCQSGSCGNVKWEVESIEFRQPQSGGDRVWVEGSPVLDTFDGYWWVYHDDRDAPDVSEFDMPPYAEGTATAQDPQDVDLYYWFEGKQYNDPPPFEDTVGLVFQMAEEPTKEPVADCPPDEPEPANSSGVNDPD